MKTTYYTVKSPAPEVRFRAAIVADPHDHPFGEVLPILEREAPDFILIPGDLTERFREEDDPGARLGLKLLAACAAIAPTFYSLGNHEIGGCHGRIYKAKLSGRGQPPPFTLSPRWLEAIEGCGATLLDESFVTWRGNSTGDIVIGGLGSGLLNPGWVPNLVWLDDFAAAHARHEAMNCICYENKDMGIYFITDPDGYWLEVVPTRLK